MHGMIHPVSQALYEQDGRGNVPRGPRRQGRPVPARDGEWIEGEIFEADPELCNWVGGPKLVHHRLQVGGENW